jgi:hypothetical protein
VTWKTLKEWYLRNERHISSLALVVGFVVDNLTLRRIDLLIENAILLFYLSIAALSIFIINCYEGNVLKGNFFRILHFWSPLALQFSFGALFSGFFVFYFRSASVLASWPFLLALLALLIGNEKFRKYYQRLTFQISIFFVALFSYSIFSLPILIRRVGDEVFIASGVLSLLFVMIFILLLYVVLPEFIKRSWRMITVSIIGIFAALNVCYFLNIIPPIPLSMKQGGVYHHVLRTPKVSYIVQEEQAKRGERFSLYPPFHVVSFNDPVYVYTSVFAPTDINTDISHVWNYYDEAKKQWVALSKITFPIRGGNDFGYRGYSVKTVTMPGRWRVDVETERGQRIGEIKFRIVQVSQSAPTVTREF